MTTDDRELLKLQLMRHEGIALNNAGRAKPYTDTVGKVTIGFGRNLTDRGLSMDEAHFLLENDVDECIQDCQTFPWFANLDPVRQRVVVDLRFNLGAAGLRKFKNTLAAIASGDYQQAADNLRLSKWYTQVRSRGARLVQMMETGRDV